jgi:O-antigen/teichoic acid export membrane protein
MVTYISLPLVLGLIILAVPVWRVFYGYSLVGASILRLAVISAMLANIYMVISTIVQSLNKFKLVYTVSIVGFVLNAVLDVPMMLLFNKIGIPAYLGSIVSSMIGFTSSILIGLISLKKSDNIKYNKMFKNLGKMMIPAITMTVVLIIINSFIKLDLTSTINSIILIAIDAIIGGIIYIGISYKTNLLYDILGRDQVNKILKKLTFGKFQG